jgi:hypothetical protein
VCRQPFHALERPDEVSGTFMAQALVQKSALMPIGFVATKFSVFRENGVLVTALGAPSAAGNDLYLMLQRGDTSSEQDFKLGMHLPHIEFADQDGSWYGHILVFSLRRNSIRVEFDAEAAERMRNDGKVEVHFNLSHVQFLDLRSALRETFAGHDFYQEAV